MQYFYNNQWYSYDDLHNLFGITLTTSEDAILYDDDLNQYNAWDNSDETWVINDNKWYYQYNLPYYRKSSDYTNLYIADQLITPEKFTKHNTLSYYNYNNHLYSYEYLHYNFGITLTESQIYYVKYGVIKCWYNPDIRLYWDTETSEWYEYPKKYDDSPIDADDINEVGSMSLFIYKNNVTSRIDYGTVVSASLLTPISMNFPCSGEFNYSVNNASAITGAWRLLSNVSKTSPTDPAIVLAIKVSDNDPNSQNTSSINNAPTNNFIETIEYNL